MTTGDQPMLEGVRVVDLSRVLAGPFAARLLGELGADVIKVESPAGDSARGIGPFLGDASLYFASLNSYKRGMVLDLAATEDRSALDALLATTDIVIENFRTAAAERFRCRPDDLLETYPHLTIITITGYGIDSDRVDEPAFDLTVQAESGVMSVTGHPNSPPTRAGIPVGDLAAGMWAALAAVAGYSARLRSGHGRSIEIPLLDSTLSMLAYLGTGAVATGTNPDPVGAGHPNIVPYGAFATADGWLTIAVIGDRFWPRLVEALGLDASLLDLATTRQRVADRLTVDAAVTAGLMGLTTSEATEKLAAADVPCAPLRSILDAVSTPYVQGRDLVERFDTDEGPYAVIRGPIGGATRRPAPTLGEHTVEILRELGS